MTQHTPPTDQQLDEIDARANAATPGPWGVYENGGGSLIDIAADLQDTGCGYRGRREICRLEDEPMDNDPTHREWTAEEDWSQVRADAEFIAHAPEDVRVLLAEVRRLRDRVAELEAHAYGCDGEGCVLPHSSWCELAKKAAAEKDGCTCPQPWEGHPQPHAGYCWLVSPPRDEVEEMRKQLAELTAENAKLIRWHREDGTEMDKQRATIEQLRTEKRELGELAARRESELIALRAAAASAAGGAR